MTPFFARVVPLYSGMDPATSLNPPPKKKTMTGSFSSALCAGVQTLRYRQSSLMFKGAGDPGWGQVAEYAFVSFTPSQG